MLSLIKSYFSTNKLNPIIILFFGFFATKEIIVLVRMLIESNISVNSLHVLAFHLLKIIGFIEIIRQKALGIIIIYGIIVSQLLYYIINYNESEYQLSYILVGLLVLFVVSMLLCLKKNGKSGWNVLMKRQLED